MEDHAGSVVAVEVLDFHACFVAELLQAQHAGAEVLDVFRLKQRVGDELVTALGVAALSAEVVFGYLSFSEPAGVVDFDRAGVNLDLDGLPGCVVLVRQGVDDGLPHGIHGQLGDLIALHLLACDFYTPTDVGEHIEARLIQQVEERARR